MDLRNASRAAWCGLRGIRMAMIIQDLKFLLNPEMTVGAS
jgi:ABC-type dipeptide/oligopeptide/nickel transport system ATPase component